MEDVAGSLAYARCPATCPLPINEKQPALNRSVGVHRLILGPEKVIQTKLFQSNNHLTAQSCRKEVDRGPKSPLCRFQFGDPESSPAMETAASGLQPARGQLLPQRPPWASRGLAGRHKGTVGRVTLRGPRDSQCELLEPAAQRPNTVRVPGPQRRGAG